DGNIVTYSWSDASGVIATGVNPTVDIPVGTTVVNLTVTDNEGATATDTVSITVDTHNTNGVVNFTLIDAITNTELSELTDGLQLDFGPNGGQSLNVRANTQPDVVGSVYFELTGTLSAGRTENVAPYALFGDTSGDYVENALPLGNYTLTATAYSGNDGTGGILGQPYVITFSVVDQSGGNQSPFAAIRKPIVNDISVYPNPASAEITTTFEEALEIESILIFDITGRLVKTQRVEGQFIQKEYLIDVYDLPTGSYFMKMIDSGGNQFQKKIVIQK
ncbi:MAG: T9SS type A sorting domain-containing protein, partial [Croceivirga sp.]